MGSSGIVATVNTEPPAMSTHDDWFAYPNRQHETHEAINYAKWLVHLIAWDGIVPVVMLSVLMLVRRFGPQNNDRAITLAIVCCADRGYFPAI